MGDTRGLPGASRRSVRLIFQTELKVYGNLKDSGRLPGHPGRPLGIQRDPKNQPKIGFLFKKDVPTMDFCRCLCTKLFFEHFARFCIVLSRRIDGNLMKKTMHFFIEALAFLNMATLTIHRILRYESYFFIFGVLYVFHQKKNKK